MRIKSKYLRICSLILIGIMFLELCVNNAIKADDIGLNTSGVKEIGLTAQSYKLSSSDSVNNILLKWEKDSQADTYCLFRSQTEEGLNDLIGQRECIYNTTSTIYEDISLPSIDNVYYYQVIGYANGTEVCRTQIVHADTWETIPEDMEVYNVKSGQQPDLKNTICVKNVYYRYQYRKDSNGFLEYVEQISDDGVNWKNHGAVLTREDDETLASCKFEAISVKYNSKTNKVVVWGHYELKSGYSTGALFCLNGTPGEINSFSYSGLIFPNGKQARDKEFFIDEDGSGYLVTASNDPGESANKTLYIHKLSEDWTQIDETNGYVAKIFEGQYREAPALVKSNGIYYLFTSQAAGWLPSEGKYATAKDLAGPWSELKMSTTTSSFGGQQNGASVLNGTIAQNGFIYASKWWKSDDTAGKVVTPMVMNGGFITSEYFDKVYYNTENGIVIPERKGQVVSQGKKALFNGILASETVDGDYETSTTAEKKWPAIWEVDLEKKYELTEIEISWHIVKGSEAHYPYIVYGSNDKKTWTKILDKSEEGNKEKVNYGFTAEDLKGKYRYIQVEILKSRPQNNQGNNWYTPQLWEVKILGNNVLEGDEEETTVISDAEFTFSPDNTSIPFTYDSSKGTEEQMPKIVTVIGKGESGNKYSFDVSVEHWIISNDIIIGNYVLPTAVFTMNGKEYQVPFKNMIVYSSQLEYFVDCNSGSTVEFPAIADAVPLANAKVADQKYDSSKIKSWGYVNCGKAKSLTSYANGLHNTGYCASSNNGKITYQFWLAKGRYRFVSGHCEWWGGANYRQVKGEISYITKNGTTQKKELGVSAGTTTKGVQPNIIADFEVTDVEDGADITVTFSRVAGMAPAVSYIAIEKNIQEEPETSTQLSTTTENITSEQKTTINESSETESQITTTNEPSETESQIATTNEPSETESQITTTNFGNETTTQMVVLVTTNKEVVTTTKKINVKIKRAKVKKAVKKKNSKAAKINLKKIEGVTGYQVKVSTSKKFKKKKTRILNTKKLKFRIKKLKLKKKYYIKVRAYKLVNGKWYYGRWSKSKKIKMKK